MLSLSVREEDQVEIAAVRQPVVNVETKSEFAT